MRYRTLILGRFTGKGAVSTLVRGTGAALAVKVCGLGITFGVQILAANLMGADAYGDYIYAIAWASILVLPGLAGWDTASLKYIAAYFATDKHRLLRGFLRRSRQLTLFTSLVLGVIGALAVALLSERLEPRLVRVLWLACMLLPVLALCQLLCAQLQGLKRIVLSQLAGAILRPLLFSGLLVLLALTSMSRITAVQAVAVQIGAFSLTLAFVWMQIRRALPSGLALQRTEYRLREWFLVSLPMVLIAGFQIVMSKADVLMVGSLVGTTEAGIYSAAAQIGRLVSLGLIAVNTIAAPLLAELHARGEKVELQRVLTCSARIMSALSLPIGFVLFAGGRFVLGLFGAEFVEGYSALTVLIGAHVVNAAAGSVGYLLVMTGHQNITALVMGCSAIFNLLLNAQLIPRYGIVGAACATAFSLIAWNLVLVIIARVKLTLNTTVFRGRVGFLDKAAGAK